MWYFFFLVVATLISDSLEQGYEYKVSERENYVNKERDVLWKGGNVPASGLPANGFSGRRLPGTNQCPFGKQWSVSSKRCVDSYGLANGGGTPQRFIQFQPSAGRSRLPNPRGPKNPQGRPGKK